MSTMWIAIAVIVTVVMVAQVMMYSIKMKSTRHEDDSALNEKLKELDRLDELEQRIKTLEAIVTDPAETLKRDINNLKQTGTD